MNKCVFIGRLTKDPELSFTANSGTAVSKYIIAVDRFKKGECDFINVTTFNKGAEFIATYGHKGKLIAVEGKLQISNYTAKDGTKKYSTDIISNEVQVLEWAEKNVNTASNQDGVTALDDGESPF